MRTADDELWDAYAATVIRTASGAVVAGPVARARASGHVITAWNPYSAPRSEAENRAAGERLRARVGTAEETRASAPDGTWPEEGLLVAGLSREAACELGRAFGQHAVFELDDEAVRVVACEDARVVRTARRCR